MVEAAMVEEGVEDEERWGMEEDNKSHIAIYTDMWVSLKSAPYVIIDPRPMMFLSSTTSSTTQYNRHHSYNLIVV